jgi:cobalt-zinc-cadmium efflux system membrane fusion protein
MMTGSVINWISFISDEVHAAEAAYIHGHDNHDEEAPRGPNGGRLLVQDDFSLEITIYETGLPPEFRVYAYDSNQPVSPGEISLEIELNRLGNKVDHIQFTPVENYLRSNAVINEPHSFEITVVAKYEGKSYSWHYRTFEGRTRIPANIAEEMGINTEIAGPITLTETRTLTGRVQTNPNRLSRVRPRFAGVVKAIRHELGDVVSAGDTLAIIQSNESLQDYQVKAPINGLIVKRDVQLGEATGNEPLFIIVDLSDVWVELDIFVHDLALIRQGQSVLVETLDDKYQVSAIIDWVSPLTAHASQSVRARVTVPNKDGALRPGQFIRGHVTVARHAISLAVRQSALQRFREFQVVFARFDDTYEVRMLDLGRQNRDWAEVLGGIEPGTSYVTQNSYLIKADIEKSGASHDH